MPNGTIKDAEDRMRHCPNMARKLKIANIRERLGILCKATSIKTSPLFTPSVKEGAPLVDLTTQNLFIRGVTKNGLHPHLKLALAGKMWTNPTYAYKIVEDHRLKDVYLGGESFRNRTPTQRERNETTNIISDIVGEAFDLVIIILGTLGYKNIAAPGILKEALMVRESLGKATWLFESKDPAMPWKFSKDSDIELYVERFRPIQLESDDDSSDWSYEANGISVDEHEPQQPDLNPAAHEVDEEPPPPSPRKPQRTASREIYRDEPPWKPSGGVVDDLSGPGGGPDGNRKKKFKGKW